MSILINYPPLVMLHLLFLNPFLLNSPLHVDHVYIHITLIGYCGMGEGILNRKPLNS